MTIKNKINQLEQENTFLRKALEALPGSIYWMGRDGKYLGVNQNAAILGKFGSPKEVVGKTLYEIYNTVDKKYLDKIADINKAVMSEGKEIEIEEVATDILGKEAVYLTQKVPLRDEKDKVIGLVGVSIDITERKKAEKALEEAKEAAEAASKAKTQFLENMRHDVRTPLSGIIGFANLMKDAKSKEKVNEYAANLSAAGQALLDLMNEVLEAVKVSTGEIPVMKKKFDLKALCQEAIKLHQAKAKQKKLDLTLDYSEQIPRYLVGDPVRIHRILLELLSNALNFTDRGSVKVKVSLDEPSEEQKAKGFVVVNLSVQDTGIGMTEEQQQELYVRFKRFTPSYQGIYRGVGLGLSIIKQFSDDIEGEISVSSQPKKGTTFTCLVPLKPALTQSDTGMAAVSETPKTMTQQSSIAKRSKKAFFDKTIQQKVGKHTQVLLVEDSPLAAEVANDMLANLGCEVDIAKDGSEAIQLFQKNPYELILMDIGLPDMDGYEVTKQIRFLEGRKENSVPIIALSAHADVDYKKRCIEIGMNAVFTKPLMKEQAEDMLKAFVLSKQSVEENHAQEVTGAQKKASAKNLLTLEGEIIDLEATKKLGLPETALLRLFPLMLKSLDEDLSALQKAYQKKDLQLLSDVTHKIKGSAIYCGTLRLKEACSRLEIQAKTEGDGVLLNQLYELVLKESSMAKEAMSKILQKKKSAAV